MKAIKFYHSQNSISYKFSLVVNKKESIESIQKAIVYTYIVFSALCGFASAVATYYCIDKMSMDFGQFLFILITGLVFFLLVYLMNKKKINFFIKSMLSKKAEKISWEEALLSK